MNEIRIFDDLKANPRTREQVRYIRIRDENSCFEVAVPGHKLQFRPTVVEAQKLRDELKQLTKTSY
jgi:hypothetical protein